jgi:hypothetical protein
MSEQIFRFAASTALPYDATQLEGLHGVPGSDFSLAHPKLRHDLARDR